MSNTIPSPNMGLPVPVVGADLGPQWATDNNSCLGLIDSHNHSTGQGVQINPSGLNINSDLPFGGNNATALRTTRYNSQTSTLTGSLDQGCLYVVGNELYYNDLSGHRFALTATGSVNATTSGISSGTATASFVAGVLVVNSAANTPANVQCASILLGNNSAGTYYVTLSPPSSLASSYPLVLPTTPSVKSIMALDTSGNMSAPYTVDNSSIIISSNIIQIGPTPNITASQISSSAGILGSQLSSSAGITSAQLAAPIGTVYTVTATGNWTCPANVHLVQVLVVGGGQAGTASSNNDAGGAGGAGGSMATMTFSVTPGNNYPVVIGSGGGSSAGLGGVTSFNATLYSIGAGGGAGGAGGGAGADGQAGSRGFVGSGGSAGTHNGSSGGGGGGGGSYGAGAIGGITNTNNSPAAGANTGGGGGGGAGTSTSGYAGGAGGSGIVVITVLG